jgi:hypothetical protein
VFAAAHLDNFLFLLFVAVAILFQLLTRAATKTRRRTGGDLKRRSTATPETPRMAPPQAEESDEDRIRKFLEALGQPTTSKPPPAVTPRMDIPPRPLAPIQPPPSMRPFSFPSRQLTSEERRKGIVILEKTPQSAMAEGQSTTTREQRAFRPKVTEPLAFEVHHGPLPISEGEVREAFQQTAPSPIPKPTEAKIDIGSMLRSSSGLRNAVILREIFGPPRSLQPLDLVGNI